MKVVESVVIQGKTITFEAGQLARQAHGAVVVRHEGTFLLATVVADEAPGPDKDFLPLTVEYREKMAAGGRIPGAYGKREGRTSDHEILVSRLVDRSLRPLFPASFGVEVLVNITLYAADPRSDIEALAILAGCAALHLSDVPFHGPVASGRVVEASGADMLVSGTRAGLVMIEGGAAEADNATVMQALAAAHADLAPVLDAMDRLRAAAGRAKRAWPERDIALDATADKRAQLRHEALHGRRLDGRRIAEVRAIEAEVGTLPTNHGSAVFTRGQTQALVSVTMGGGDDALQWETALGKRRDRFILHYNFPSFSVGEIRAAKFAPGRREIGHGALAQRALAAVLPSEDELPAVIRVVSDILESNGSSSMATVCGATLALMDAGVPIARPVAGIAMGLVAEGEHAVVLTDIAGAEDAYGDMDFKVAGTSRGITALQLDQKVGSLPLPVLGIALDAARPGLDHILAEMVKVLSEPRAELASAAPQVQTFRVPTARIGSLIGPGGKTIQEIQNTTQTRIDVKDDGRVRVTGKKKDDVRAAVAKINALTAELEVGKVYRAEVVSLKDFGCFVRIGDHEGLVHVSELAKERVEKVAEVVKVGDVIDVKVLGADDKGRLKLSKKAALK